MSQPSFGHSPSNPDVKAHWETALALLNPTPKELETGLIIHAESPVVESYSLGLHAPPMPAPLNALIQRGATRREFFDLAGSQIMTRWAEDETLLAEYRDAWAASGVTCSFLNAGEESNDPVVLLKRLARYMHLADARPDSVARVLSPEDISRLHREGLPGLCLTLNGVPLEDGETAGEKLSSLRTFAQLGARMMHLTYNAKNPLGCGCLEEYDDGLSDLGAEAIRKMNALGIIVDLAHTGWRTSLEAARHSSRPVLVSHATVHALHPSPRAKPDEVIRAVLETGGAIGMTNYPAFLGQTGDIRALVNHLDHMIRTYGADSVTIGTDTAYQAAGMSRASEKLLPPPPPNTPPVPQKFPDGMDPHDPIWKKPGMRESLAWTNWPLFTVGLVQRGHSEEVIRQVIGGNMIRIFSDTWQGTELCVTRRDS